MLRQTLENRPETVRELELAAEGKYWEGLELMALGRRGAGIYLMGYVVWKQWGMISQQDRSELIMDACEQVKGPDWSLKVVVAMGLTPDEAQRMGIEV